MKKIFAVLLVFVVSFMSIPVFAISEVQGQVIMNHCDTIKDDLKKVQKSDARARVYLGRYYEKILTDYTTPLNVKLVETNSSSVGLVENQRNFATGKTSFSDDFIKYQKELEELVGMSCKNEPEKFYEKLTSVRKKRRTVEKDTIKMRELITEQEKLVSSLMEGLK